MKAVLCRQYGPPESLTVEEIAAPQPGAGEALVAVKAASVNFPDVLIIQNKYQVKPPLPFSPGAEMAGVVHSVGAGVTNVKPGDRVLGLTTWGAFAEQCVADAKRLIPLPAKMDYATAASFLLTYGTSHHALRHRASTRPGETMLVLGAAGGVGIAAVEIGKILGLRVIACASSADKLAVCRTHGADETIDYAKQDLRERIKVLTAGRGVDIIYDPVGGALTEAALRSLGWGGRLLVIGFAAGEIPRIPLNLALLNARSILGVYWGDWSQRARAESAAQLARLGAAIAAGELRPVVSARLRLEDVPRGLEDLLARRVQGKLVAVP